MNLSSLADLTQVLTYLKQVTETSSLNRFSNEKYKELQAKQKELEQLFIVEVLKISADLIDLESKTQVTIDPVGSILLSRQRLATEGGTVNNTFADEIFRQARLNNSSELTEEQINSEFEKILGEKESLGLKDLGSEQTQIVAHDPIEQATKEENSKFTQQLNVLTELEQKSTKKKNPKVKRKSANEE